jgi:uncharacterized FlaG/YvyC family protein
MVDQISPVSGAPMPSVSLRSAGSPGGTVAQVSVHGAAASSTTDEAVAQVNQHFQATQSDFKLQVDPGSDRTVFQLIQKGTGQILMQIPSAEVLGMSRRIREMEAQTTGSGTLLDKQG